MYMCMTNAMWGRGRSSGGHSMYMYIFFLANRRAYSVASEENIVSVFKQQMCVVYIYISYIMQMRNARSDQWATTTSTAMPHSKLGCCDSGLISCLSLLSSQCNLCLISPVSASINRRRGENERKYINWRRQKMEGLLWLAAGFIASQ